MSDELPGTEPGAPPAAPREEIEPEDAQDLYARAFALLDSILTAAEEYDPICLYTDDARIKPLREMPELVRRFFIQTMDIEATRNRNPNNPEDTTIIHSTAKIKTWDVDKFAKALRRDLVALESLRPKDERTKVHSSEETAAQLVELAERAGFDLVPRIKTA